MILTKFYKVGGAVRDEILQNRFPDIQIKDVDFAVEALSFDVMRDAIISKGGKIFLETPKFMTIRANVPGLGSADYVLCRKDGAYSDGRHPDSVSVGTIYDDLARRDFTCNAIAVDTDTGAVIDPYNGRLDIEAGILRAVGSAKERLNEDKLRAFRAVRFAITKQFEIDEFLYEAIKELNDFSGVSTERIREELLKMFTADSEKSFQLLYGWYHANLWRVIGERGIWFKPTVEKV